MGLVMLNYLRSEDGAGAAEYALILAVLGGGLAVGIFNLRAATRNVVANAAVKVASADTSDSTGPAGQPTGPGGTGTGTGTDCGKKKCK